MILRVPYAEMPIAANEAFPDQKIRHYPLLRTSVEFQGKISQFAFLSIIDSGADNCIFPAIYGRRIGIPVESGKKYPYAGAAGLGVAYFHNMKVSVEIEDKLCSFDCYCGFADGLSDLGIGLLGRHGFFELFRSVSFRQNEKIVEFELNPQ